MIRVKICGLTDWTMTRAAVDAGADAVGFVFAEGRRQVSPEQVRTIVEQLPPYVTTVGVFVNEGLARLNEIAAYCRLDLLQLHGTESPDYCAQAARPVIKTIAVRGPQDVEAIDTYLSCTRGILLDAYVEGASGGTGRTFSWEYAVHAAKRAPIILAGGLHPGNVEEAIRQIRPYAVDVSSGVETAGVKDPQRIQAFIERVRLCAAAEYAPQQRGG
ncbi:phosphoribosylanthranilate isomerase [Xylanibacillus composti]|uniref:N-(5'-phosphoribosyl)anthranilate isomerase n=1 Tax=Xylanibacillus composti TaxID=1572762 RepID=A0A8J4GZD6_9BACL|nr:phosphoribosylanthranilate isomerase [Xylanibacillus composti]MDT9726192.1 phosphoribosylanthranilate isomerase [Xylanibacillus composti]GIQ68038.1 N-(5'-phosphoribosyl)anthranilate isomerase [Xylanibacillus composti]